MNLIENKIIQMGIKLPEPVAPIANYVSIQRTGNLLFCSGAGPFQNGVAIFTGRLGEDVTVEQGYEAARLAAINLLAAIRKETGNLDSVVKIVKMLGFVSCTSDFFLHPSVINGASDLLVEVFGEKGRHARSAVAAPVLPLNIPVEIELIVEIADGK